MNNISIDHINSIARNAPFSAVVEVAQRFNLCAVGGPSSAIVTTFVDSVCTLVGRDIDPNREYVVKVAYDGLEQPHPAFIYRSPETPESLRITDIRRIRKDLHAPFGKWFVAWSPTIDESAIAYPMTPKSGEYWFNRSITPFDEVLLINPRDGLLPLSFSSDEQWMLAVGFSMYDWEYARQNIYDLRHADIVAIEAQFFDKKRIGWRFCYDDVVDVSDVIEKEDRLSKLISGRIVGDYPPTPEEVMRALAYTGRMPRTVMDVLE